MTAILIFKCTQEAVMVHDNRHEYREVFSDDLVYYDKVDVWCSWCSYSGWCS